MNYMYFLLEIQNFGKFRNIYKHAFRILSKEELKDVEHLYTEFNKAVNGANADSSLPEGGTGTGDSLTHARTATMNSGSQYIDFGIGGKKGSLDKTSGSGGGTAQRMKSVLGDILKRRATIKMGKVLEEVKEET